MYVLLQLDILYKSMSLNICTLTGNPLVHPVVSLKTGHLFQKQAIQKHLSTFPYCPITNTPMTLSDIITINNQNTPLVKVNQSTRVFMQKLQNQYDTIVLETHYLRQNLKKIKEQIMHTAYMNQAAERVIGRLLKEKMETQAQILKLRAQLEGAN